MKENRKEPDACFGVTKTMRHPGRPELSLCAACGNYIAAGSQFWTDGLRGWCSPLCTQNGTMVADP